MSDDFQERGLEIERAQLRGFERSIAGVEWLLLLLVALYFFGTDSQVADQLIMLAAVAGFAGAVVILRFVPQLRSNTPLKITLEIFAMVTFLTVVLHQVGDDESPLLNLYLLPIIAAALVLGKRGTVLVTVLVCLCYFLLATAHLGLEAFATAPLTRAAAVLLPFLLVAVLTSLLAEDIQTAKRRIRALSDRDELTSLLNIRAFMRMAEREHRNTVRRDGAYSILLVDIDHLRQINDTYGHEAGNRALRTVAEALLRVTRSRDLVARFGGEEFIACLAGMELTAAADVAQRLRNLVYSSTFEVKVDIVRIQASAGVANFPVDGDSLERVMSAAEKAMYQDKALRAQPDGKLVIQKR